MITSKLASLEYFAVRLSVVSLLQNCSCACHSKYLSVSVYCETSFFVWVTIFVVLQMTETKNDVRKGVPLLQKIGLKDIRSKF